MAAACRGALTYLSLAGMISPLERDPSTSLPHSVGAPLVPAAESALCACCLVSPRLIDASLLLSGLHARKIVILPRMSAMLVCLYAQHVPLNACYLIALQLHTRPFPTFLLLTSCHVGAGDAATPLAHNSLASQASLPAQPMSWTLASFLPGFLAGRFLA